MKNNKFKNLEWPYHFFRYGICLFVLPIALVFIGTWICLVIKSSRFDLINDWITNKRSFISDFNDFYINHDLYTYLLITVIILICLVLFIILSIPVWIKKKTKLKGSENVWEYNQFLNEGMSKKQFVKEFNSNDAAFSLGYFSKNNGYVINKKDDVHSCVLGISGSGKTEKVIIPNIFRNAELDSDKQPIFLITDPKKQILERTGNKLIESGYEILVFDLEDSDTSLKWNPLKASWDLLHQDKVLSKNDYANAYLMIDEVVDALPFAKDNGSIWVSNAKNVLNNLLKFLLLYSLDDKSFEFKYFNLANINSMLNYEFFASGTLIKKLELFKSKNIEWNNLYNAIYPFTQLPKETLGGFLSNISNALNPFIADIHLKEITSNNSIDLNELFAKNKPFAIFLCYPDHKESSQLLVPIFLNQLYKTAIDFANLQKDKKLPRTLQIILEEFASLPKINNFWNWLSISRSRRIYFMVVLQDYEQLAKYNSGANEADIIKTQFGLTYFLETNNERTLESIVKMLGTKEVEKISKSQNNNNTTTTTSNATENVMSLSQLKFKDSDMMLIIALKTKPIAFKPIAAYEYLKNFHPYYHQKPIMIQEVEDNKTWDFNKMELISFENNSFELKQEQNALFERMSIYAATIKETMSCCLFYKDISNNKNKLKEDEIDVNEWE